MKRFKAYRKQKDLIKSAVAKAIDKAIKAADRPEEEKLADYILRLNNIKLDKISIKKILRSLK